jgi:hypothetical protein
LGDVGFPESGAIREAILRGVEFNITNFPLVAGDGLALVIGSIGLHCPQVVRAISPGLPERPHPARLTPYPAQLFLAVGIVLSNFRGQSNLHAARGLYITRPPWRRCPDERPHFERARIGSRPNDDLLTLSA